MDPEGHPILLPIPHVFPGLDGRVVLEAQYHAEQQVDDVRDRERCQVGVGGGPHAGTGQHDYRQQVTERPHGQRYRLDHSVDVYVTPLPHRESQGGVVERDVTAGVHRYVATWGSLPTGCRGVGGGVGTRQRIS